MHRLYLDSPLQAGVVALGPSAMRHVRALRLRAGDPLVVFDGGGGQWQARLGAAGDSVELLAFEGVEREAAQAVELAVGMPANERMDWLVEKAVELGAQGIAPLMTSRAVLRLEGERAERRCAHWRGVAIAACEQCGRNRLPQLRPVQTLERWLRGLPAADEAARCLLAAPSQAQAQVLPLARWAAGVPAGQVVLVLSGPEGGLDDAEIGLALRAGFVPVSLGPRTLRAETAPLALLAGLAALRA